MKVCGSCRQELSENMFCKNRSKPDGLCDWCRECKSRLDKEYRERHKDKCKDRAHEYYISHREQTIARTREYIDQNKDKHNAWGTKAKNKLKRAVFAHYCDNDVRCRACGESDLDVLSIDHVNGDGASHRREIYGNNRGNGRGGYNFYRWLKRNKYPDGFQVLCFNCQFRKRMTEMRPENPTHTQQVRAKYARSIKLECLEHYGGLRCPCGEDDQDVLSLDHVNDDGAEDRRKTGRWGLNWYINLRKAGFPNDPPLQVLCMNCQMKKRQRKYEEGKVRPSNDSDGAAVVV